MSTAPGEADRIAHEDAPAATPAAPVHIRPFLWSVRRELWEHPALYLAPVAVGAVTALALVIAAFLLPESERALLTVHPKGPVSLTATYWYAAALILFTGSMAGALYCVDALNGERRDRSILFWKSLPLSDFTVVLAKAAAAMAVLPLITLGVALLVNVVMLLLSLAIVSMQGASPAALWNAVAPFRMWLTLVYAVAAATLWHAPIYSLLLLLSGTARRTSALWVVLPIPAVIVAEVLTYNAFKATWFKYRLMGWYDEAFALQALDHSPFHPSAALMPGRLLGSPGLWSGLLCAALFLAVAARLRRKRGPI